jgi:hypothetical protein
MTPFLLAFGDGRVASAVRVTRSSDLADAFAALGLAPPRPVVVVVGGADGLDPADEVRLCRVLAVGIVPAVEAAGAVVIDGGTAAGVMRLLGVVRADSDAAFPLVGIAATGTVVLPDDRSNEGKGVPLDRHHSHFVLVPGDVWGCESPWIASAATSLAQGGPSATVVVNGGDIVYADVERSVDAGRAVIAVAGTGRAADELASAVRGEPADERATALVKAGCVTTAAADDPRELARAITATFAARPDAR